MTTLIRNEMWEMFYMLYAGLAVMLLFSVRNEIMNRCRRYERLCKCIYLLFWILAAFLFSQFLYRASYGAMSWYGLAAFGAGMILWKKVFCGILNQKDTVQIYNGDKKDEKKDKRESQSIRRKTERKRRKAEQRTEKSRRLEEKEKSKN